MVPSEFEAGLKRPRDSTESTKLISEAAVAVRCHARILPIWIQYKNDKDETQFNTFLDHLSMRFNMDSQDDATRQACTHVFKSALQQYQYNLRKTHFEGKANSELAQTSPVENISDED